MSNGYYKRETCRYCGSKNLFEFLDLGDQPPSNSFLKKDDFAKEKSFPLKLSFCKSCSLVQLQDVVSGNDIFDDYYYLSSSSKALVTHFERMTSDISSRCSLTDDSLVIDIGCNDGITLDAYKNKNFLKVGIEPSNVSEIAKQKGHIVYNEFFNKDLAKSIRNQYGHADVITATNVFAHVDDMHGFIEGIPELISDKGIFVVELSYLPKMIDSNMFDTVYHEHLCYVALTPLVPFLENFNLEVFDVEELDMGASGPAARFFIKHKQNNLQINNSVKEMSNYEKKWGINSLKNYIDFSSRVFKIKDQTNELIRKLISEGNMIGGFGAPAKGNTLLNFFELNDDKIKKISENNLKKINKYTPGSHIKIISDEEFIKERFDFALLLAWNYKNFFIENSDFIKKGGKFIIPFPEPHIEG